MSTRVLRRLVRLGEITVRRTVAAGAKFRPRVRWTTQVYAARRRDEVARGAAIWSPAERATIEAMMGRGGK